MFVHRFFNTFRVGGVESWKKIEQTNGSKNGIQDGMHLGIDFGQILLDFWSQVGVENRPKFDPKTHRKTMQKEGQQNGQTIAIRRPNPPRGAPSRAPGRSPPPAHLLNMNTTLLSPPSQSQKYLAPPRVLSFYTQDFPELGFRLHFFSNCCSR